jgi:hypothetical protein
MTKGVVIILGVAAAILAVIVFKMRAGGNAAGLAGGVPYFTPGAPNYPGGPPLPGSNKLSTYLQGVTATAKSASDTVDSLTSLWEKTGKSWLNNDSGSEIDPNYVDSLPNLQS